MLSSLAPWPRTAVSRRHTNTGSQVLRPWSSGQKALFRRAPMTARHTLHDGAETAGLFTLDALADLLDRMPPENLDVQTMGTGPHAQHTWLGGSRGTLDGAALLEAVRAGRLWLNLRHVMNTEPAYQRVLKAMFDGLRAASPGFHPLNPIGSILISSPGAEVFYHADQGEVVLWHLRGTKRLWAYPNTAPFLPDAPYEGSLLGEKTEDLPYCADFDRHAAQFTLEPGHVASWPHAAPHRIENGPELNVSITTEFTTLSSRVRYGAYYANGVLRRAMGLQPDFARMSAAERVAKFALSAPLRALKASKAYAQTHLDHFEVDLDAPACVRLLAEPRPVQART